MSTTIDDLRPRPFEVIVRGVKLLCQPPRLSHAMTIARAGNVLQDDKAGKDRIKQAEADIDEVIGELIPELKGVGLDMNVTMELIGAMMDSVKPDDNKELEAAGVKIDADPKA